MILLSRASWRKNTIFNSRSRSVWCPRKSNRLTTITRSLGGTAGPQVVMGYDPGNRLTSINRTIGGAGTAVTTSLSYDAANRLTTLTHQVAGGSGLATYVYQYDAGDRLTHESNNDGNYTYSYDNDDELTGVSGTSAATYSYNSTGDRTMTGYTTGSDNETTASPNTTYTYDGEGNLTSETNTSTDVTTSYSYDYRDRLTTVSVGGTLTATYTYDALDRRIGTDLSGTQTWTVYDGNTPDDHPYADFNGSGALTERYLYAGAVDELLARTSASGTTAWYLTDKLGSVRDIANTSGAVIDHVVYDPYGNIVSETAPANGDRFKYAGMQYDAAIALYYDHARYYDPVSGRFIRQDPLGLSAGDVDLYRYVDNGPLDGTDPTGLWSFYRWLYACDGNASDDAYNAALAAAGQSALDNSKTIEKVADAASTIDPTLTSAGIKAGMQVIQGRDQDAAATVADGLKDAAIGAIGGKLLKGAAGKLAKELPVKVPANGKLPVGAVDDAVAAEQRLAKANQEIAGRIIQCFAAGTPLLTPDGQKPIEDFRPGDWVLTAPDDDPTADPTYRQVEEVYSSSMLVLTIHVRGQAIRTTAEHPFWVRGHGWKAAGALRPGDQFRSHNETWVTLESVGESEHLVPVYNMRVADYHTYFVGSRFWGFSVWAHNSDPCLKADLPSVAPSNANNAASHAAYKRGLAAQEAAQNPTRSLNDPLPPNPKAPRQANPHAPDPAATGPHTVLGTRTNTKTSPTPYRQGITYNEAGNPVGRTDVTTHGRGDHPNPHYHPYDPNIDDFGPQGPFPF